MKQCPVCNKVYRDYDQYCVKCNYKLKTIENSEKIEYPPDAHVPSNSKPQPSTPTITCPYCKSTDCKKISGLSKAGSVALWGIFALGKTTKQWHCNSCKSDF